MKNSVVFTSRVFNENKGGNSRYAHALRDGLIENGWSIDLHKVSMNKYVSAAQEVSLGLFPNQSLIHYLCDTGQLLRTGNQTVTTVHGIASLHNFGIRSNLQEYVWRKRVELALKMTDAVITPSESSKIDIIEVFGTSPVKINVIGHGINHDKFHNRKTNDDFDLLSKLRYIPSQYILYIGNLDPRKNLGNLLAATHSQHWPRGLPLVIVGKFAWGDKSLLESIHSNDRVVYLGQLSDEFIAPLYRNAELFIFPSLYEGFGFPVLEALACGAPVLTTSRGNLSTFQIKGQPIIEDPLDPEEIAKKTIQTLEIRTGNQEILNQGLRLAGRYRWEESVKSHIDIYSKLNS